MAEVKARHGGAVMAGQRWRALALASGVAGAAVAVVATPAVGDGTVSPLVDCSFPTAAGLVTTKAVAMTATDQSDPVTIGDTTTFTFVIDVPVPDQALGSEVEVESWSFELDVPDGVTVEDVTVGRSQFGDTSWSIDAGGRLDVTYTGEPSEGPPTPPGVPELEVEATVGGAPRTITWMEPLPASNISVTLDGSGPFSGTCCPSSDPPGCSNPGDRPLVALLTTEAVGDGGHPFSDVPGWVEAAVDWAWGNGLMTGFDDGTFGPDLPITRGQVARLVYRIAGEPPVEALDEHGFSDVPDWVGPAVRWLAHHAYVTGYDDDTFRPNLPITRGQVARMLYRTNGSPQDSEMHGFDDVPDWLTLAVNWLADPDNEPPYVTGYDDGTFRDHLDITRAQTTRMACRVHTTPGTC